MRDVTPVSTVTYSQQRIHTATCTTALIKDGFVERAIGTAPVQHARGGSVTEPRQLNLFDQLAELGVTHHAYDAAMGCYAKRLGWDVWMLPIKVHHFGGRTAVGDPGYQAWAESVVPGGDRTFWELAHSICYEEFRNELPIRVKG